MNMKSFGCLVGLIAICVLKAALVWTIWLTVVGALALIGAVRVVLGVAQPDGRRMNPGIGKEEVGWWRLLFFICQDPEWYGPRHFFAVCV